MLCVCGFRWMASCGKCDSRVPIWIHLSSLEHTYGCICTDVRDWCYTKLALSFEFKLMGRGEVGPGRSTDGHHWVWPSLNGSLNWELIWGTLRIPRLHGTKIHSTLLYSFLVWYRAIPTKAENLILGSDVDTAPSVCLWGRVCIPLSCCQCTTVAFRPSA